MANEIRTKLLATKTIKASDGDAAITLTSLANGAYRQSTKLDLGASPFPAYAYFRIKTKPASAPTALTTIPVFVGWSNSADAGTDNPANLSGTDAAYTGYNSDPANAVLQLQKVGDLILSANAVIQTADLNQLPIEVRGRYPIVVVGDLSGQALSDTATDHEIIVDLFVDEMQ